MYLRSTQVVYSQVAHAKCLHMQVPYTDTQAAFTRHWSHTLYLYKDITNKGKLQNITHLSVSNPSIDAIFLYGNKEVKIYTFHVMYVRIFITTDTHSE